MTAPEPTPLNREQRRAAEGFRPKRTTYRIRFDEDHELHGLVLSVRSVPLGKFLDLAELADVADRFKAGQAGLQDVKALVPLFETFASCVVEWNLLDDNDQPVEPSAQALLDLDPGTAMALFERWTEAMAAVPAPLSSKSSGGSPYPEERIPMGPLPENRPSWSAPG